MQKVSKLFLAARASDRARSQPPETCPTDASAAEQLTRELARTRQFSAMVAHEMRNLMAPLVYGAELLGRTDDEAITRKVRHDILISVANLRRLLDDLLLASGCDKGRMALVTTFLDLRDVVTTSVELVRPMFPTRGHHIDVVTETDDAVMVTGDFCRLTQVISNLVINAAKFTPDEGDIVVLLRQEGSHATITVKDTGIGIAPEALPHLFDGGGFANGGSADNPDGLGLGLTIAKKLVKMHGGELTAYSAGRGKGSEFRLRLPIVTPS